MEAGRAWCRGWSYGSQSLWAACICTTLAILPLTAAFCTCSGHSSDLWRAWSAGQEGWRACALSTVKSTPAGECLGPLRPSLARLLPCCLACDGYAARAGRGRALHRLARAWGKLITAGTTHVQFDALSCSLLRASLVGSTHSTQDAALGERWAVHTVQRALQGRVQELLVPFRQRARALVPLSACKALVHVALPVHIAFKHAAAPHLLPPVCACMFTYASATVRTCAHARIGPLLRVQAGLLCLSNFPALQPMHSMPCRQTGLTLLKIG